MNFESKKNQLIEDFKNSAAAHLSPEAIAQTVESLNRMDQTSLAATTAYGASGSIASLVFYVSAQCTVNGGKTFNGSAWGVSFPGGGALFGDVYLNDASSLDDLYARTSSFTFTATPVYTAYYFYDSNQTYLGSFQAGSVSTATGVGGGSGSWS